jgi:hypothetical protein
LNQEVVEAVSVEAIEVASVEVTEVAVVASEVVEVASAVVSSKAPQLLLLKLQHSHMLVKVTLLHSLMAKEFHCLPV